MSQMTFSDYEYSLRKRKTKREEWVEFVRPYYPNGKRGRPTKGIEKMLRMYLLQIWFNLSDEGVEDAIYDSYAFRKFMNIDFMEEQVLDATTLLKIRYLLEENYLWKVFFKAINRVMEATGHIMHGGLHERYFPERLKSEQIIWIAFRIFQNPMCIGMQFAGGAV